MSRRIRDIFIIAALVFSTAGMIIACGQKGPLYFPEEPEEEKDKESQDQSSINMPHGPA